MPSVGKLLTSFVAVLNHAGLVELYFRQTLPFASTAISRSWVSDIARPRSFRAPPTRARVFANFRAG